jgi:sugar transferase EpsL
MYEQYGKRVLDLAVGVLLLIAVAPLLALVGVLVRLGLGPSVLHWDERAGYRGKTFTLVKFRTMAERRDANGALLPDEERLTRLGRFLRSTSLDELPELLNVIRGEMSLVGPRPLPVRYLGRYSADQARRHDVKPGITGWAQVQGRNALSWDAKLALDVWYTTHVSFLLDLQILVQTLHTTVRRHGISHPGHATAPEFTGSNPTSQ